MAGARAERVRLALGKKFSLTPSQVEQLLANAAGPLVGLKDHQEAWALRSDLQQLGVECSIAPVPRSHLAGIPRQVSVQSVDPDRRIGHAPRPMRASYQANSMRSGKSLSKVQPRHSKPLFTVPPLVRVALVVAVALVVGLTLQFSHERHADTVVVAESGH